MQYLVDTTSMKSSLAVFNAKIAQLFMRKMFKVKVGRNYIFGEVFTIYTINLKCNTQNSVFETISQTATQLT